MQDSSIYEKNISEEFMMEAIKKQLQKNDKVSFQFNNFLYTELKQDTLDMSQKMGVVQEYDNGRKR